MTRLLTLLLALAVATPLAAPAHAETPPVGPSTYALVIGANRGGAGQRDLRFAESDARRVAALLGELGGTPAERVRLVLQPSSADIDQALDRLAADLAVDRAAGR